MQAFEKIFFLPHPLVLIPELGADQTAYAKRTVLAYQRAAKVIAMAQPDTIIFVSPHVPNGVIPYGMPQKHILVNTASEVNDTLAEYGVPDVASRCAINTSLSKALLLRSIGQRLQVTGTDFSNIDHGTFVPMYFIQQHYRNFEALQIITPMQVDDTDLICFGQVLRQVISESGRRCVLVISGDLSHKLSPAGPYGFSPQGLSFDRFIRKIFSSGELQLLGTIDAEWRKEAGQCAMRPLLLLAGAIGQPFAQSTIYSHEHPFGIGYMIAEIEEEN